MNRAEMEGVLASGGSVLYKGRHILRPQDLPTQAELAPELGTEEETLAAVKAHQERLAAEAAALEKAVAKKKAAKPEARKEPEEVAPLALEKEEKSEFKPAEKKR